MPGASAPPPGHSDLARRAVHVGMLGFALLLRYLTPWQAAACALVACAVNLLLLPRVAHGIFRPGEHRRTEGIALYPVAVLALVLTFPRRPDIAGAAWAILAAGDGLAGVVGTRIGGPSWPWNPRKTLSGSLAFVVFGGAAAVALSLWGRPAVSPAPPMLWSVFAPLLAAVIAAVVETRGRGLNDNLTVPASAAAVLWASSLVDPHEVHAAAGILGGRLPWALGVNAVAAMLGFAAGTVSRAGLAGGFLIGVAVYLGGGWPLWVLLFAGFALAAITSRLGLARKAALGIAEDRQGRRGAGNAFANCGIGAAAALLAPVVPEPGLALLAASAALVAGASDTAASEIGKARRGPTYLPTTLARVPAGTPGAMSRDGTLAGLGAAALLGATAAALQVIAPSGVAIVVAAATAGALVESVLAATLEGRGAIDNDTLNVLNTGVAAAAALALARVFA
jgi:uncharacterized protein (TIGR00297 family)